MLASGEQYLSKMLACPTYDADASCPSGRRRAEPRALGLKAISCYHFCMAQLLVRHLDDDVKAKLQRRARRHGHSTEEEVREILRNAVKDEGGARAPLGSRLAARFAGLGLKEDIPELRGEEARPADLES